MIRNGLSLENEMLMLLERTRVNRDNSLHMARIFRTMNMPSTAAFMVQQARFGSRQVLDQTRNIRRFIRHLENA